MAIPTKYEIEHKCGHAESRDLSDVPAGQRAGKAEWWAGRPCFDCYRKTSSRKISKELQAERAELRNAAVEDQERSQLPLLHGSEKQVPWATDSRFKLLRVAYEDLVQEGEMSDSEFEERVLALSRRIDSAKWWIDNREATSVMLLELLVDPGVDPTENENPY